MQWTDRGRLFWVLPKFHLFFNFSLLHQRQFSEAIGWFKKPQKTKHTKSPSDCSRTHPSFELHRVWVTGVGRFQGEFQCPQGAFLRATSPHNTMARPCACRRLLRSFLKRHGPWFGNLIEQISIKMLQSSHPIPLFRERLDPRSLEMCVWLLVDSIRLLHDHFPATRKHQWRWSLGIRWQEREGIDCEDITWIWPVLAVKQCNAIKLSIALRCFEQYLASIALNCLRC